MGHRKGRQNKEVDDVFSWSRREVEERREEPLTRCGGFVVAGRRYAGTSYRLALLGGYAWQVASIYSDWDREVKGSMSLLRGRRLSAFR
jgi:hypothetical protein